MSTTKKISLSLFTFVIIIFITSVYLSKQSSADELPGVYLYEHAQFQGRSLHLTEANITLGSIPKLQYYDFDFDKITSSIKIVGNYSALVYKGEIYSDDAKEFTESTPELEEGWNDSIRSIFIRNLDDPHEQPGVYLYDNENYTGRSIYLKEGDYNILGDFDFYDKTSSLKIVGDYAVTLFRETNFTGDFFQESKSVPKVDKKYNDIASSVTVHKLNPEITEEGIYFFGDIFQGNYRHYTVGEEVDLAKQNFNDVISSIRIIGPYAVTVYKDTNMSGDATLVNSDIDFSSGDKKFDDAISSFSIEGITEKPTEPGVYLCEHPDYQGRNMKLDKGYYPTLGDFDERTSSILIIGDYRVQAFNDPYYVPTKDNKSADWIFKESTSNLNSVGGSNDALSSVIVEDKETPLVDNSDWMGNLYAKYPAIGDMPFNKFTLPGAHAAGSFNTTFDSGPSPDIMAYDDEDTMMADWMGRTFKNEYSMRKYMYRWTKTQEVDYNEMLKQGVRYFDLSLSIQVKFNLIKMLFMGDSFDRNYKTLYTAYGYYGEKFESSLQTIKAFMDQHPKEIVMIDFRKLTGFDPVKSNDYLEQKVHEIFGDTLIRTDYKPTTPLKTLWERNKRVLVMYGRNLEDPERFVASSSGTLGASMMKFMKHDFIWYRQLSTVTNENKFRDAEAIKEGMLSTLQLPKQIKTMGELTPEKKQELLDSLSSRIERLTTEQQMEAINLYQKDPFIILDTFLHVTKDEIFAIGDPSSDGAALDWASKFTPTFLKWLESDFSAKDISVIVFDYVNRFDAINTVIKFNERKAEKLQNTAQ